MRIILDGMGGDNAPAEIVKGAVQAAAEISDDIIIVGDPGAITAELEANGYKGDQISIRPAMDVITMHDSPVKAIRRKTDSSMVVGLNMLKDGEGDMLVSAGNTGALIVGARLILGRIRGIDRPALASIYPDMTGGEPGMLVDAGASSESKARNLVEYAIMGSTFVEKVWGRENPRVGLVNLGAEESKGTSVTKDAYQMLANSHMNFVGNVEGRDVPKGVCDVIVCDGFTGNVILKLTEGVSMSIFKLVKNALKSNLKSLVGGALVKSNLTKLKEEFDYEEFGGAPVLGVNAPVIKMHGSSNAKAVKSAILRGTPYARENVVEIIGRELLEIEEYIEEEED
ncbi:MAG: phosphate acyltransferase PlsX [Clostridia bacterium]|nr:phosphate acyltransferase PlsX [Clostridia bacterium]